MEHTAWHSLVTGIRTRVRCITCMYSCWGSVMTVQLFAPSQCESAWTSFPKLSNTLICISANDVVSEQVRPGVVYLMPQR